MKAKPGKRLGGEPPRRTRRERNPVERRQRRGILTVLAVGLFVVGVVIGFGWSMDREIRGGILRQAAIEARRPDWVPIGALPAYVPEAFLAVTDPSLLSRGDLARSEDQPPLAEQLVEQVHELPNTLAGQARAMLMGPLLKRHLTRRALAELFLNRSYMGSEEGYPVYGIYSAAHEYFGEEPQELTLSEAATLAGLLLPPRVEDPEKRPGAVGARRNEVLRMMLRGGLIDEGAYRAAVSERLGFQPGLEQMPMTRPVWWGRGERVIRLPPSQRPTADSTTAANPGH